MINTTVIPIEEMKKQMKDSICLQNNIKPEQIYITIKGYRENEGKKELIDIDGIEMEINS